MAKGKKRRVLSIDNVPDNLVDKNAEGDRMDDNEKEAPEQVDDTDRALRAKKRLFKSTMPSHQPDSQHDQEAHIGQIQQERSSRNMEIQQQALTSRVNLQSHQEGQTSMRETPSPRTKKQIQRRKQYLNNLQAQQSVDREQLQSILGSQEDPSPHVQSEDSEFVDRNGLETGQGEITTDKKAGRGPAHFPDDWLKGRTLEVSLNDKGQIVGRQYQALATAIGCLAKVGTKFSISQSWNSIDEEAKEAAWKEVQEKTLLPEQAKRIIYAMLNSSWREWKYRIKSHFLTCERNNVNDAEMIKSLDNRVVESQFLEAVSNWRKAEVQEQACTNAANRGQRKFPHRTGRTAFSEVIDELTLRGASATPLDVWVLSRSLGKGVTDDEETSDLRDFLVGTMASVPVEDRTAEFRRKLYHDVVQNDKCRTSTCVGKSIYKKSRDSSSSENIQTIQEKEDLRMELRKLKEEREEMKQMKDEMKQEREQLGLKLEQVNELIKMFGLPQSSPRFASCSANVVSSVPDACSTGGLVGQGLSSGSFTKALKDGVKVSLFGDDIPKDVVANGLLISKDPEEKVANLPLGPDY